MSEELDKLKGIGAQKIYEETHIPVLHVQAILHSSFDSFSRVQFLGFVSILEREYTLNLQTLKAAGLAHFDDKDAREEDDKLFVVPKKPRNQGWLYALIALCVFLFFVFYQNGVFTQDKVEEQVVDNTLIEKVQEKIQPTESIIVVENETNTTSEQNSTEVLEKVPPVEEEVAATIPESFKIVAKSKVWFGYIDVDTNKKYQTTFTGAMDLDPQKEWLLIFGHGYVDMFVDGNAVSRGSRDNIRFLYKDGNVTAISSDEFKRLNRGNKW